jgi:hypothetical protein
VPFKSIETKLNPNFRNNNTCFKGSHNLQHHEWLMPMIYIYIYNNLNTQDTIMEAHEPQMVYNIQVVNALSKSYAFNQT